MSYQVLARKWRPHDFSSLLGQDHVVRALTHALTENRLHHAYLFTGTRGVGKTTISRILAKCLNCVGEDGKGGITAEPCGKCEACRAIDEDRFVDYIEMDAASTRGIDDMVSLLERAKYVPTSGRFKVYMIDEVHQLTSAAFNAMLKTLEEPPEYVKFILATTDPQKVPVTVLSRCLQFNLKSLSPQLISDHMAELLVKEGVSFEKPALRLLANGARGSMRDGLSLLDQAIAYSAGNLTLDSVREMLGTVDSTTLVRLLGALANRNAKSIMAVADEIGSRSLSYNQAMKDLALLLHQIAMAQQLPDTLNPEEPDAADLAKLAQAFSPSEVQLYYQIAIHGRNEMHLAPDEYAGFTMAILRMLAFAPFDGNKAPDIPAPITEKQAVAAPLPKSEPAKAEPPAKTNAQPAAAKSSFSPVVTDPQPQKAPALASMIPSGELPPWDVSETREVVYVEGILATHPLTQKQAAVKETPEAADEKIGAASDPETQVSVSSEPDWGNDDGAAWVPADLDPNYDDLSVGESVEASPLPFGDSAVSDFPPAMDDISFSDVPSGLKNLRRRARQEEKREVIPEEPIQMNPWLEAASEIHLEDSAQPLVTSAELISFENNHMELKVDLEKLTDRTMVDKLTAKLRERFGEGFTLSVSVARCSGQNLRMLGAQKLRDERRAAFASVKNEPLVKKAQELFGFQANADDVELLDANGQVRKN